MILFPQFSNPYGNINILPDGISFDSMSKSPKPGWDWDEEYNTNIRSCPEGYTFVRGYRDRDRKYHNHYCRKLREGEKSRTVEVVRKRLDHERDFAKLVEQSDTLSSEEWQKKYNRYKSGRRI